MNTINYKKKQFVADFQKKLSGKLSILKNTSKFQWD